MIIESKLVGYVGLYKDSTERKRIEDALNESEERYRTLFESAREAVLSTDTDGKILSANPAALAMLGYTLDELVNKHAIELYQNPMQRKEMLRKLMEKGYVETYELTLTKKDGTYVYVLGSATVHKDSKGNILRTEGIFSDITERKKAEEELRKSEEQSKYLLEFQSKVIDTAIVWIDLLDADGNVTLWNRAAELISGYSRQEVIGHGRIWEWLYPDSKYRTEVLAKAKKIIGEGEQVEHFETTIKCKDETLKTISWHSNNILDEHGKPIGSIAVGVDVTEIKKTRERVRESEEKYRSLFENARDLIVTVDIEGNITSANNILLEYGYERNELVGKSVFNLLSGEYWEIFQDYFRKLTEGKPIEGEFKIKSRQMQKYRIVEYRSNPIIQDGKVVGAQVIVRDVTERREIEEKLRDSEEKFRAINASANDAILLIDDEGKFSYWNPAAEKMFGYTKEEADNKKMYELITPERFRGDHTSAFEKFKKTGEGRIIGKTVEMAAIRKDGTEFPVEFSLSALQVKEKQYALGIVRDITERKKMEERLKQYSEHLEELVEKKTNELLESEKRYSALVEEANDGVAIIQDEKIVFVNKKAPGIIGYTREEMIGLPFETFLDENYRQHVKELYQRKLRGEAAPPTLEMEWIAKTSEHVPVELSATLINYLGSPAILVIIRDISERKRIEKQHVKLEKLATIGELATMVAHDLRNPLTSIRNASFYVKGTCPHKENTECRTALEMLNIIDQETIFANNIINELLEFSTKGPLQKGKKNINRIIEDSLKVSNIPKSINIEKHFAGKTTARVDKGQLQRVLLNIIQNAAHSMPNGGKLIITTTGTKDHVEITFTDTGTGMAKEGMSKLFTPFFTTKAKGIGLGLAICKRIVEEHGGTIGFKSKVGQGTTFTITLPKKKEESNL
jgi:PAS domain S-box-containing protein